MCPPLRLVVLLAVLAAVPVRGAAQPGRPATPLPPCAACIALILSPGQAERLPSALNGLELLIAADPALSERSGLLEAISRKGGRPGVLITAPMPSGPAPVTPAIPPGVTTIVLDIRSWSMPADVMIFSLRTQVIAVRASAQTAVRLGVWPPPGAAAALARDAGGYWDFLVTGTTEPGDPARWLAAGTLLDAGAAIASTRDAVASRWLFSLPEDDELARRVVNDLALAAGWLPAGLVSAGNDVTIACGGGGLEVFLDPGTLNRIALADDCGAQMPVSARPAAPVERVQLSNGQAILRVPEPAADRFTTDVGVSAAKRLTAEEIVARHQAAAARQSAAVQTLISAGSLTLTFEAPGFPAPVSVGSAVTIYRDGLVSDLEQRDLRVNGIALSPRRIPRLPIIEAERVAAPPLVITLGDTYRYRLVGEETRGATSCYVVAFEPRSSGESLFRGRVWIAADDFGLVRIEAVQTGLRGPVVSSEQTDDFTRTADGVWVLARSDVSQLYQGAAYRTPIHRLLAFASHDVNATDFTARRAAAYASDHAVLRDTPAGYRYLERDKGGSGVADAAPRVAAAASRVRTLAYGVIIDPNITRPLPFAGLSYVDFNLFGTGAQLNAFFGGTYGQLAFSVPSLGGSRWQLAGRAFGIAASYNDRVFVDGREQYERDIRQRPAFGSVWLTHPVTPRVTFRAAYELDYTHFAANEATAANFTVPADQAAHGLRVALDAQRRGWDASLWWSPVRRSGWRGWGQPDDGGYRPGQATFQRYGATLARSLILSPRLVFRGEAAAMAGHDLDRFSRYAFGTFDNRLRGYPAALIRYDRGAVIRTALAWSAARVIRADLFGDVAFVHDQGFGRGLTRFPGVGAAIEAPAPFGMLLAAEWGYGVRGVNADGRRGTQVIRITGYKVF